MLGFRTGKANPDLFFDSFLPKAYFRILRRRARHKQTKNIKNKFSQGQSSGGRVLPGVYKVLGLISAWMIRHH